MLIPYPDAFFFFLVCLFTPSDPTDDGCTQKRRMLLEGRMSSTSSPNKVDDLCPDLVISRSLDMPEQDPGNKMVSSTHP